MCTGLECSDLPANEPHKLRVDFNITCVHFGSLELRAFPRKYLVHTCTGFTHFSVKSQLFFQWAKAELTESN